VAVTLRWVNQDPTATDVPDERIVILVNGMPASGKTTLARELARRLRLPLFSKDVIKEAHAEVFGAQPPDGRPQRDWNSLFGAAASSTMWHLLADSACGAVLESTWPASETWEFVKAGLESARIELPLPLQVWCEVPVALARERYALRHPSRHPVHGDQPDDAEWEQRWALARPLPIPDTLHVDTTGPVDLGRIIDWCTRPRFKQT
jgi:predicted kinase